MQYFDMLGQPVDFNFEVDGTKYTAAGFVTRLNIETDDAGDGSFDSTSATAEIHLTGQPIIALEIDGGVLDYADFIPPGPQLIPEWRTGQPAGHDPTWWLAFAVLVVWIGVASIFVR